MNSIAQPPEDHRSPKGLIAFCETNLRYEKGFKAWIFLGPYLLGAVIFEAIVNARGNTSGTSLTVWLGFLAYLILFPTVWRRVLRWRNSFKLPAKLESSPQAQ